MNSNTNNTNVMLTTVDNPFNPFSDYRSWYNFDTRSGYHTCSLIARIAVTSHDLSDEEEDDTIIEAFDAIIDNDAVGIYKKVTPESFEQPVEQPNQAPPTD